MVQKSAVVLQDVFLNQVRKERVGVTIHLVNGFQIRGIVKGFDNYVVLMDCEGKQMVIYKHAISTITPSKNIFAAMLSDKKAEDEPAGEE